MWLQLTEKTPRTFNKVLSLLVVSETVLICHDTFLCILPFLFLYTIPISLKYSLLLINIFLNYNKDAVQSDGVLQLIDEYNDYNYTQ